MSRKDWITKKKLLPHNYLDTVKHALCPLRVHSFLSTFYVIIFVMMLNRSNVACKMYLKAYLKGCIRLDSVPWVRSLWKQPTSERISPDFRDWSEEGDVSETKLLEQRGNMSSGGGENRVNVVFPTVASCSLFVFYWAESRGTLYPFTLL